MEIAKIQYDLEQGFAWAEDQNGRNIFQVCLRGRKDKNGSKKEIKASDCGADWGICGDVNLEAHGNMDAVRSLLPEFLKEARKSGIKIS